MKLEHVLQSKGNAVETVRPSATVTELLAKLAQFNIGALVVSDDGQTVVGIVSERDVVRWLHQQGADVLRRPVAEIMSDIAVTCTPDDPVDDLAALMTDNRVRHVPVLADGRLAGIVSIGDVVKRRMDELAAERQQLRAYITQGG